MLKVRISWHHSRIEKWMYWSVGRERNASRYVWIFEKVDSASSRCWRVELGEGGIGIGIGLFGFAGFCTRGLRGR
ncbi:hypothetical protein BJY00DRAFT_274672 [Aspergillus carlsbadensis]|nr:hypothetical protein BJY00DRAFT_274672 [Aspergillus carlsbadensis]